MKFGILRQRVTSTQIDDLSRSIAEFETAIGGIPKKSSIGHQCLINPKGSQAYNSAAQLLSWFWRSGLNEEFEARTRQTPVLLAQFCTIRRHLAGRRATHVDWHFDASFVGFGGTFLVFWVPLDPVGEDSPGLDFYFPRGQYRLGDIADKWRDVPLQDGQRILDDAGISAFFDGKPAQHVQARLDPGDLVFFDETVPHRTQHLNTITRDRTAIEFRVTSLERPVPNHVQFDPDIAALTTRTGEFQIGALREFVSANEGSRPDQ